jgi:catechol 2,3-dioxygenase-like lactoylglutathione lyase family enzyme
MSVIKVEDIAYVRFSAPDLTVMKTFLEDFGLVEAEAVADGALYMRGAGEAPCIHVCEAGPPAFLGVALRAGSLGDLQKLAESENTPVRNLDGPGGGKVVRLVDPDGFPVEVVAGQSPAAPRALPVASGWNCEAETVRQGAPKRLVPGPSRVLRLGHVVLLVADVDASWTWWQDRFGLIASDDVRGPDGGRAAIFARCDQGSKPVDHHTLNLASVPGKSPQFHHAAFEVADFDSLMTGHDHLVRHGYRHSWGVGRHILGSQVFDYWLDPSGHRIEHWTDGDVFAADEPSGVTDLSTMLGHQWGPQTPEGFV